MSPKDQNGNEIKVGDIVGMEFDVLQADSGATGCNIKLRARNVPAGEQVANLHIHSGATRRVEQAAAKAAPTTPATETQPAA